MKETPQQKYQRLVNEIQELVQEVDTIQVSSQRDTLILPSTSGRWMTEYWQGMVVFDCLGLILQSALLSSLYILFKFMQAYRAFCCACISFLAASAKLLFLLLLASLKSKYQTQCMV